MKLPEFSSPLVIRPGAKQLRYGILAGVVLCALGAYLAVTAVIVGDIVNVVSALLLFAASAFQMYTVARRVTGNVAALIPSAFAVGIMQIIRDILHFLSVGKIGWQTVLGLIVEIAFWVAFLFCTARAVCGQYKLLVPMAFLFFAFFYTFVKFELRDFAQLLSQILLLLILWFPLDAIAFTSLYVKDDDR